MLCQNCGKNDATTHYHSVINGVVKDKYLCSECVNAEKQINLKDNDVLKMLTSFFNDGTVPNIQNLKCECCGTTFSDIRNTGKVGCGNCYSVFKEELVGTLQRIHGRTIHVGKRPSISAEAATDEPKQNNYIDKKQIEIDNLKEQLKKAIETENYEEAAKIRDLIRHKEA